MLDALIRSPVSEQPWGWWIAFAAVFVATVIDWNSRRIPNLLTFPLALVGLALNAIVGGWMGLAGALVGLVLGLLIFLLFMALGAMGAGDVKLMAALGALLGVVHVFWIGLFTAVMGGVLVVLYQFDFAHRHGQRAADDLVWWGWIVHHRARRRRHRLRRRPGDRRGRRKWQGR